MSGATTRPWKAKSAKGCWCLSVDSSPDYWIATGGVGPRAKADMELAAKAVNNHDALIAVCKDVLAWLASFSMPPASTIEEKLDVMVRLEDVIAAAEATR